MHEATNQPHDALVRQWNCAWRPTIESWVTREMADADSGHGIEHIHRVVQNARGIGSKENANPEVYLPAAWLHDCVSVPKNSPERSRASRLAASKASAFLNSIHYPSNLVPLIVHCIEAHSFSAGIPCGTIEAQVVQDSDRLEALGAIGMARCFMTGGSMKQRLYHPDDPFPTSRIPRDTEQSIDHFFAKLLGLHKTMQTETGKEEARGRTGFLCSFLHQLGKELGAPSEVVEEAIQRVLH